MSQIRVLAPAKINLVLAVGPQRLDGYHDLVTVFHAIDLVDELTIEVAERDIVLTLEGQGADELPVDERNLIVRAAQLLRERYGSPELGARIHVSKTIPVAGGMAGGSGNAAAALVGCAQAWGLSLRDELFELAAQLGSDVPFALLGGNALGQGRGERLQPLPGPPGSLHWALALAHGGLSTPQVFKRFDELGASTEMSMSQSFVDAVASGDVEQVAAGLRNDLQAPAIELMPQLAATLAAGEQFGALAGIVSGSGPTCAFLCAGQDEAQQVAERLAEVPLVRGTAIASGPVPGPLTAALA